MDAPTDLRSASLDDLLDELYDRHKAGRYRGELLIHIAGWLYELAVEEAEAEAEMG